MKRHGTDTDQLLDNASRGDGAARAQLLDRHRQRLRQMIALRIDRRLAARVDPSDVVQEALIVADRQLDNYLLSAPCPSIRGSGRSPVSAWSTSTADTCRRGGGP